MELTMKRAGAWRSAFTLVELIAVMVVLAILAGVAAPRFFNYGDQAKTAALEGSLGGMRSSLAQFYANQAMEDSARYPTLQELETPGTVMQEALPKNPYNGLSSVQRITSRSAADNRSVSSSDTYGWNYFYDNAADPAIAVIWANSDDETEVADTSGDPLTANEL
jgi:prepilin-type N-terminal cleavage/methylation domain-containing protein